MKVQWLREYEVTVNESTTVIVTICHSPEVTSYPKSTVFSFFAEDNPSECTLNGSCTFILFYSGVRLRGVFHPMLCFRISCKFL